MWVETDAPCTVVVEAGPSPAVSGTFTVHSHHYALVDLVGLPESTDVAHTVTVDGVRAWPEPGRPPIHWYGAAIGDPPSLTHLETVRLGTRKIGSE